MLWIAYPRIWPSIPRFSRSYDSQKIQQGVQETSYRVFLCLRIGRCAIIHHKRCGQIGSKASPGLTSCWISNFLHKGRHLDSKTYRSRAFDHLICNPSICFPVCIAQRRINHQLLFCLMIQSERLEMEFGMFEKVSTWYWQDWVNRLLKEVKLGFAEDRVGVHFGKSMTEKLFVDLELMRSGSVRNVCHFDGENGLWSCWLMVFHIFEFLNHLTSPILPPVSCSNQDEFDSHRH